MTRVIWGSNDDLTYLGRRPHPQASRVSAQKCHITRIHVRKVGAVIMVSNALLNTRAHPFREIIGICHFKYLTYVIQLKSQSKPRCMLINPVRSPKGGPMYQSADVMHFKSLLSPCKEKLLFSSKLRWKFRELWVEDIVCLATSSLLQDLDHFLFIKA